MVLDICTPFQLMRYLVSKHAVVDKIAFYVNQEYTYDHYKNVINRLDPGSCEIILSDRFKEERYDSFVRNLKSNFSDIKFLSSVLYKYKYRVLVTHLFVGGDSFSNDLFFTRVKNSILLFLIKINPVFSRYISTQYFQKKLGVYNIRFTYGVDVKLDGVDKYNYIFDCFFCHGPKDAALFCEYTDADIFQMGYPRYDSFFDRINSSIVRAGLLDLHNCSPDKQTILCVFTVSRYFSTIELYVDVLAQLTGRFNVILRPHPMEINKEFSRYNSKVKKIVDAGIFSVSDDPSQEMADLYLISDYVVCDYGGSIFSALFVNKRILLLNHPDASQDPGIVNTTSMEARELLPSVDYHNKLSIDAIFNDQIFWDRYDVRRKRLRDTFFHASSSSSSDLAANKLLEILSEESSRMTADRIL